MRQRHVPRAELVDHPEDAQVAADPVPGLDADQARDLALGHRLLDAFRRILVAFKLYLFGR